MAFPHRLYCVLGTAAATLTAPRASAAGMRLIDFSRRLVPPDQIKSAGYTERSSMCPNSRPGATFDFKPVTREYADGLRAAGLHVVSCYQFGKPGWPDPSDFTRGYDGGVADAQTALRLHAAAGGRGSAPIFFSVDEDIDLKTWTALLSNGFEESTRCSASTAPATMEAPARARGRSETASSAGQPVPGTRGPGRPVRGLVARASPGRCCIRRSSTPTPSPGAPLDGTNVDMNDVLAADFGQWDLDPSL